jgi:hypothetical protein
VIRQPPEYKQTSRKAGTTIKNKAHSRPGLLARGYNVAAEKQQQENKRPIQPKRDNRNRLTREKTGTRTQRRNETETKQIAARNGNENIGGMIYCRRWG